MAGLGRVLIAAYVTSTIVSITGAVSGAGMRNVAIVEKSRRFLSSCLYYSRRGVSAPLAFAGTARMPKRTPTGTVPVP